MHDEQSEFDNLDIDPAEFRRLGYRAVDMMAEYFEGIHERAVFPPFTSKEVEAAFEETLPEQGQSPERILQEWQDRVLPYATHLGSPRYFGYVNGSGTMIGALAEALAACVNMNPGGWKPAPAATEIERRTIRWLAEMIGYPTDCGGLITSGGTMANFTGLLTALRNLAPYDSTLDGLQNAGWNTRFKIYMSDHEGHVSIKRVADLTNLGRNSIRLVPSRDDFTIDPGELERAIEEDRSSGEFPLVVVAQVGSINVGAIDPIDTLADICQKHGLWLHADGACGAVGAMLPEMAESYQGLERADSVTLDPHKWLYVPYECGCVLVRDSEKLRRAFSMTAPYLRGTLPTEYTGLDYFEYGPQMSRGFKSLKLWMTLKHYGVEGYRRLLRQNLRCARHLDGLVRSSEDFQAFHAPTLYIYSFRYAPSHLRPSDGLGPDERKRAELALDDLNQSIADAIQLSGEAFIMTSRVQDRVVLRMSICSHRTRLEDIERVFSRLRELGEQLRDR